MVPRIHISVYRRKECRGTERRTNLSQVWARGIQTALIFEGLLESGWNAGDELLTDLLELVADPPSRSDPGWAKERMMEPPFAVRLLTAALNQSFRNVLEDLYQTGALLTALFLITRGIPWAVADWRADPPDLSRDPLTLLLFVLTAFWPGLAVFSLSLLCWPLTAHLAYRHRKRQRRLAWKKERDEVHFLRGKIRYSQQDFG